MTVADFDALRADLERRRAQCRPPAQGFLLERPVRRKTTKSQFLMHLEAAQEEGRQLTLREARDGPGMFKRLPWVRTLADLEAVRSALDPVG